MSMGAAALCALLGAAPARAEAPLAHWLRLAPYAVPAPAADPAPVPPAAGAPAAAPSAVVVANPGGAALDELELARRLGAARIVYAGEQHDLAAHHRVQAAILESLHAQGGGLALGLEMLSFELQPRLDDFLAGRMSEADFAALWGREWGYDFALYRPVLDYARRAGVPVVALNAPKELVRKVAKTGLAALTPAERARLPARVDPIADPRYKAYVLESLRRHGPLPPEAEARMLEAMQVWNETMGERAAAAAAAHGRLLVIAGSGHMLYGGGVPESAARRGASAQAVVLPYPLDGESLPLAELLRRLRTQGSEDLPLADYFWLLPDS